MADERVTTDVRAQFAKELARPQWQRELDTNKALQPCQRLQHQLNIRTLHGTLDDSRLGDTTITCRRCQVNVVVKMPESKKTALLNQRRIWDSTNHRIGERRRAQEARHVTFSATDTGTEARRPKNSPSTSTVHDETVMLVYTNEHSAPQEFVIKLRERCVVPTSLPQLDRRMKVYLPSLALFVPLKDDTPFYVYGAFLICHSTNVNFRDCRKANNRIRELHDSLPFSMPIPMFLDSFEAKLTTAGIFGGR